MRSIAKCDIMFASSGGFISMKTKIIYISGNEVFNVADIRAAFEEVRSTLGLGSDTIMFGVPVDKDDALVTTKADTANKDIEELNDIVMEESKNDEIETTELPKQKETKEKIVKKPTVRKKRVQVKEENNTETQTVKETSNSETQEEKIIPILSILAAQTETHVEQDTAEPAEEIDDEPTDSEDESVTESDISISTDYETSEIDEDAEAIADKITDDAPEAPIEKTLEQLLESMTPLREDMIEEVPEEQKFSDDDAVIEDINDQNTEDDADATLEQLAAEFAENQDKIPIQPKNENHSKIGKLKNILPFKKAKRDETGLMGDLFGWAGIAANDDDFAIPGFFTNAASKK